MELLSRFLTFLEAFRLLTNLRANQAVVSTVFNKLNRLEKLKLTRPGLMKQKYVFDSPYPYAIITVLLKET